VKKIAVAVMLLVFAGCQRTPGEVTNKVLTDFGLRDRPEGYVSESDKVFQKLGEVGAVELKRMNENQGKGEVKFQQDGLRGMYYKEIKVYENFSPVDASAATRTDKDSTTYCGYIEYGYRIHQSERVPTRTEALAQAATIPTDTEGREVYRYTFDSSGAWDGSKGQRVKH
jgi:hypothetical protein